MEKHYFDITYAFDHKADGVTVCPGAPVEDVNSIEGKSLKVVRPDGSISIACVSSISRLCQEPDDHLALCLSDVSITEVPVGSKVFLII